MTPMEAFMKYKIIQALRKVYFQMNSRKEVMNKNVKREPFIKKDGTTGKRDRVFRQCEDCEGWFATKEVSVDHINPVVPCNLESKNIGTPEFTWDSYIDRLFCPVDNLSLVCNGCHSNKTALERALRKNWRDFRKGYCSEPLVTYLGKDYVNYVIDEKGYPVKKD